MRLSEALAPERILDVKATDKIPAIQEIIDFLSSSVDLGDCEALLQHVMKREAIGSTGVDKGVAITHAHCAQVQGVTAALGISRSGLDYGSPDGQAVKLVFLILSSPAAQAAYLSILGRTARLSATPTCERPSWQPPARHPSSISSPGRSPPSRRQLTAGPGLLSPHH